jgi:hypothetical protein
MLLLLLLLLLLDVILSFEKLISEVQLLKLLNITSNFHIITIFLPTDSIFYVTCSCFMWSWDSKVSIVTRIQGGQLGNGFNFWKRQETFMFWIMSRLALNLTWPPAKWVPEAVSLGVKW